MIKRFLPLAMAILLVPATGLAQSAVFTVRHAERADAGMAAPAGADPDLSDAGRARAETLASMLRDARITAIFVTELKRTQQTAAPLAKQLGLTPSVVSSKDPATVAARVTAASGNVLVVGHSTTVPAILKALGIADSVTIDESDFGNLFIVDRGRLLRLRYE